MALLVFMLPRAAAYCVSHWGHTSLFFMLGIGSTFVDVIILNIGICVTIIVKLEMGYT